MKPLVSVILINISLLLVFFLVTNYLMEKPHVMPIFTTALAGLNLVMAGLGFLDRKKEFMVSFLVGFAIAGSAAATSWILFVQHAEELRKQLEMNA